MMKGEPINIKRVDIITDQGARSFYKGTHFDCAEEICIRENESSLILYRNGERAYLIRENVPYVVDFETKTYSEEPESMQDVIKEVYAIANNSILFADNADYKRDLRSICRVIKDTLGGYEAEIGTTYIGDEIDD